MKILNEIKSPKDIKALNAAQLADLCSELRVKIIETVAGNGGHLASNLGVVELTVALHCVLDTPTDQIVWDVGHQCYAHKMLTGRADLIHTIRQKGGISGFPKRGESEYDPFGTGHSSTAISAALGLSEAKRISGTPGCAVAVIGDGALSGGLAYEGLNNAGRMNKNFIVILNDNEMSISKNVGSMARYLAKIRLQPFYLKTKSKVKEALVHIPFIGEKCSDLIQKSKSALKDVLYHGTLFEDMGFVYYGPIDGHDLSELIGVLTAAKQLQKPVFVHINTIKGKGYRFAEKDPKSFHGISGFNISTGLSAEVCQDFSAQFGKELCEIAEKDEKICAITAAMKIGTGLCEFASRFPGRFFDTGIAEGHAVTFASGLAAGGITPVFAVYSSFLRRGFDQIVHDAATQNLHVVLAVDRAGVVGEDGETHQGIFDSAFLNSIPNVSIFAPSFFSEIGPMLKTCVYDCSGVAVLRYPKGAEFLKPQGFLAKNEPFGLYGDLKCKVAAVTYGRLFSNVCAAQARLGSDKICVVKLNRIKPIDSMVFELLCEFKQVNFFEEGILCGGIGEHFGYLLAEAGYKGEFNLHAIGGGAGAGGGGGGFISQGTIQSTLKTLGLDEEGIYTKLKK